MHKHNDYVVDMQRRMHVYWRDEGSMLDAGEVRLGRHLRAERVYSRVGGGRDGIEVLSMLIIETNS